MSQPPEVNNVAVSDPKVLPIPKARPDLPIPKVTLSTSLGPASLPANDQASTYRFIHDSKSTNSTSLLNKPQIIQTKSNILNRQKKDIEFKISPTCVLGKDESAVFPVVVSRQGFFNYTIACNDTQGGLTHYLLEDDETKNDPMLKKILVDNTLTVDTPRNISVSAMLV
jgi:hypothetical protein